MTLETWLLFLAASVAISVTPGPNALLCLDHGARYGLGRAGYTVVGSVLAMVALVAATMAGLGALMLASETVFMAVKWVGAAYLIWIGIRLWRAEGFAGKPGHSGSSAPIGRGRAFGTGAAVMLSNPKTILFFTTFLPQFITPGAPLIAQFAIFAATLATVELGVELMLAGAAGRLAPWLARHARAFNRITGGAFVGIGGMVAFSR